MENQFQQLRFSISEKVRLQPQQSGIRTLLELDLYPDVQVQDEGQHLKIQGYLRLHGQYLGDQLGYREGYEEATTLQSEEIAYVIPVEITLPADKAAIDYIEAEIESFDYQIQSEFELQIDAILTIDGILPEETDAAPTVVVEEEVKPEPTQQLEQYEVEPEFTQPLEQYKVEPEPTQPLEQYKVEPEPTQPLEQYKVEPEPTQRLEQYKVETETPKSIEQYEGDQEESLGDTNQPSIIIRAEEEVSTTEPVPEIVEEKQIQQEKTVAPYVEKTTSQETVSIPQELKIEIEKRESPQFEVEAEQHDEVHEEVLKEEVGMEEKTETQPASPSPSGQWSNWLIRDQEGEKFTPMRMVIVQQDDTLDSLASKYEVSVNTLVSLNKLSTDRLEQGQIIKIPGTKRAG